MDIKLQIKSIVSNDSLTGWKGTFLHKVFQANMVLVTGYSLKGKHGTLYKKKKTFCGFPWVETSTAGRVYDLCVYYMTGAPEGSPKVVLCGFMEKPGIETWYLI